MLNETLNYQLGDWNYYSTNREKILPGNNITFGGNIDDAYTGHLKLNLVLSSTPWLFNVNYQGLMYDGNRASRNESFVYGSVDPLFYYLGLPNKDYQQLK